MSTQEPEPETPSQFLEGITSKTKKDEIMERLRNAVDLAEIGHAVQTIARVRRKWQAKGSPDVVHTVIVAATEQEWLDSIEFLSDLEDILPAPLARLVVGGRIMFELEDQPEVDAS